jgi:uncharacterized protein (DUF302 family)
MQKNRYPVSFLLKSGRVGAGLFALTGISSSLAAEVQVSQTAMLVEHVTVSSSKPYQMVKHDLEARINKLENSMHTLATERRVDELRAGLTKAAGSDGLVLHYTGTHGDWLVLKGGEPKPVTEYFIGNVLSAVEMTSVNYAAGLYAPLRIVLYEGAHGGSVIEYDKPSTQLSQYHSPQIDAIGRSLDERLARLVSAVEK